MKENVKVVRIQDLAIAYHAKDHFAYRKLINDLGISKQLKSTLTSRKSGKDVAKNPKFQEQYIEIIKREIERVNVEIEQSEFAFQNSKKKLQEAKERVKEAEEILKKAEEFLKMVQGDVKKQEERKSIAKREEKQLKEQLLQEEQKLEKVKTFTLVHPTATITALDKCNETTIVCTKFDRDNMQFGIFADIVVDTKEFLEIDIPQNAREKFSSEEEFQSAVEYVKLIVAYWAEDKEYKLLYNSEGIKYILEKNLYC